MSSTQFATAATAAFVLLAGPGSAGAQRPGARPAPRPVASAPAPVQMKGVWEPVNYREDINLTSVYFVTASEGWTAGGGVGGHGVMLHTTDGGDRWNVALGDPAGSQQAFSDLQFIDRHTGFAVQKTGLGDHTLLRTTDGAQWSVSGTVPQHRQDYRFLSAAVGVTASGSEIRRTTDGGRTWKKVFDCALKVELQGLTRSVRCEAAAFAFASATVGYAIGNSSEARALYVLRTDDAGVTWSVWLAVPDADGREGHVFFTNEQTGYICTADGRLFGTSDGGKSWTGLAGAACEGKAPMLFADPEVGWTLRYRKLTYTTDGGKRWASQDLMLPASVNAFSLPRRDRAFAVGAHGMVYRYRVVPALTTIAVSTVTAPAMPVMPMTLGADVIRLQNQVGAIDSGLAAFVDPGASTASASPGTGFAQDAVSPFVTSCCAQRLGTLQVVLNAITGVVPDFTSKYRNLNLLTQGLRTAAALPDVAANLKAALQSFRASGDKSAAVSALAQVKALLATLHSAADTALQQPTFIQ